ncbi:MAG: MFS transporter [Chitinophagaceae bacterium]|nr:MFS transporter [Chitinophagaceae bacterium]
MDTQPSVNPLPYQARQDNKFSRDQIKVAATGFASLFSLIGIMFYGLSFFYDFWVRDMGWSRVTITSGSAFGRVTVSLLGFLVGGLIDKFGPRKLILLGVLLGGFAFMGFGLMTDLWQFFLFSLMAALGYICGGPLPNQVLTTRWFTRSRGKAMGFAYIGVGVGGMLVPQIARYLNTWFGWHTSLILLGILMVLIAFPVAFSVKDAPPGAVSEKTAVKEPDIPVRQILKNRSLYLLMIGSTCSIAAVSGTSQHLKLFFSIDLNYTQEQSANLISIVLFSSIIGRLFMGWMADRIPKKFVMIVIYLLVAAAIPMLYFAHIPGVIYAFAFVFGMALGGDYMIIPLMTAELFGIKVLGKVMGIILTTDVIADALSPMLVGWIRDKTGSYFSGFEILITLAIIGTIAILLLPQKRNADPVLE